MKTKIRKKGKNITVSQSAYKKISFKARSARPKRNLREQVNVDNDLSINE